MATTPPTVDFWTILSESKKIMKAHSRHFLGLSVLFLLPISFSFIAFPTVELSITKSSQPNHTQTLLRYSSSLEHEHEQEQEQRVDLKTLTLFVLYAFTVLTFFLCSIGTITYSVFHGFFGRPVKFIAAVRSLSNSLVRLFVTVFCTQVIILGISGVTGLVVVVVIKGIEFLGFGVSYDFGNFKVGYAIGMMILGLGLFYLKVIWVLSFVIVAIESSWGFEPLRRSMYLVNGMRGVSASLLVFFGGITMLIVWISWVLTTRTRELNGFLFVLQTVVASACVMGLMLYSVATNTVLYMYCKALHGELAMEIVEEFARDYVSLPFDEGKVPHIVSFIQP